jgi:hypothetical protein
MFVVMKSKKKTLLKIEILWTDLTLTLLLLELLPPKLMKLTDKKELNLSLKKEEYLLLLLKNKKKLELKEKFNPENGLMEFSLILMLLIKEILNIMLSLLDNKEVLSKKTNNELIEYICTIVVALKTLN